MEDSTISPVLIYSLCICCIFGLVYMFLLYNTFKNRVAHFNTLKGGLYMVKNIVQYHEMYSKVVRWCDKLGQTPEDNKMREELFTLLKNRKDHLGIKKNVKIIN